MHICGLRTDLDFIMKLKKKPGMLMHTCNSSTLDGKFELNLDNFLS